MKILISSFVYYPEPIGLREHDLAAGLVKLGHEVFVITGLPSYPAGIVYAGYEDKVNKWENVDGVNIFRVNFVGNRKPSPIKRISSFIKYTFLTISAIYSQNIKPDIIRANQLGLPGYLISYLRNIPFFLDVQDMWPEWASTSNFSLSNLLYLLLDWQQKMVYKRALKITTISKGFKQYLIEKGVAEAKICIIPNWAPSNNFQKKDRNDQFGNEENLSAKFNIIYAGNIGSAQGVEIILETAKMLVNQNRIQFLIIGDGLEKDLLQTKAIQMGLQNVKFLGRKDPALLAEYFAWADVLFLPLRKNPIYEVTIPSKTYTYLACGRPILVAAKGDVADLISEINAGIVVPPEDPKSIAFAINYLMNMDSSQREQYGFNGLSAYQKYFDRNVLIRQYDQLIRCQ